MATLRWSDGGYTLPHVLSKYTVSIIFPSKTIWITDKSFDISHEKKIVTYKVRCVTSGTAEGRIWRLSRRTEKHILPRT